METSESKKLSSKPLRLRRPNQSQLGLLALLVLVGGGAVVWRTFAPPASDPAAEMAQGFPPVPVQTVALKQGAGIRRVQLLGQVEARRLEQSSRFW
jgi:HlyD family secretion protein